MSELIVDTVEDESGGDSEDGANSTSSSYSSLSDLVTDIQNSEISGDTPGMYELAVDNAPLKVCRFLPPQKKQPKTHKNWHFGDQVRY